MLTIRTKAGTTELRTGLKVVVRSLETRSWLILIWRDSTQIVYVVGQIIMVEHSKKSWKLHRKMPRIHLEIQPDTNDWICQLDKPPGVQICYPHKTTTDTSKQPKVIWQMTYMIKDQLTIALYELCQLDTQLGETLNLISNKPNLCQTLKT